MNSPAGETQDATYGIWSNPQQAVYIGLSFDPAGAVAARCAESLPPVVIEEVSLLHQIGQYRAASDRLLTFVDHCVESLDHASLELLLSVITEKLRAGEEQFANDHGQARLINVLAMTSGKAQENESRQRLRAEFLEFLAVRSGRAYAEKLLGNL
jgi:hypothetical protein